MNNAATPGGRGQGGPNDAEPFFPSEGAFNTVVPLSEIGGAPAPAPLVPVDPADVGKPAEAAWAREAHRAGREEEEETTLVPARPGGARAARQSWAATASVFALSVAAGLAAGAYLIWSSQRAPEAQPSPQVVAEAPALPPAPVAEKTEADAKVEREKEAAAGESSGEDVKAERARDAARPAPTPRAERVTRAAAAEAGEATPAPRPAPARSATPPRARTTTAVQKRPQTPSSARSLPVSSPPPAAKSKKVIQWP